MCGRVPQVEGGVDGITGHYRSVGVEVFHREGDRNGVNREESFGTQVNGDVFCGCVLAEAILWRVHGQHFDICGIWFVYRDVIDGHVAGVVSGCVVFVPQETNANNLV